MGSTPSRGAKQTLKPCAYKGRSTHVRDGVPLSNELGRAAVAGEVNREDAGSRSESEPEEGA